MLNIYDFLLKRNKLSTALEKISNITDGINLVKIKTIKFNNIIIKTKIT